MPCYVLNNEKYAMQCIKRWNTVLFYAWAWFITMFDMKKKYQTSFKVALQTFYSYNFLLIDIIFFSSTCNLDVIWTSLGLFLGIKGTSNWYI